MIFFLFPFLAAFLVIRAVTGIVTSASRNTPRQIKHVDSVVRDLPSQAGTAQNQVSQTARQPAPQVHCARIQSIAADATRQETKISTQSQRIYKLVHSIFDAPTMTGQKYLSVVDSAYDKVRSNHQTLLRQMQTFDERGYMTLSEMIRGGYHRYDNIDDAIQEEQLGLFEKQLDQMTSILNDNERIFLFLEKLSL
ncbi:MAG: hypothetical protein J6P72_06130, partial [Firmicutes bacterium]|nr:hypothetical protein [Bacillota bacterium]